MKLTALSKSVRKIGLIGMLAAIALLESTSAIQAQAIPAGKPGSVCSDAYFANPDFMYSFPSGEEQMALINAFSNDPARVARMNRIWAKSNTFSVELDAPVGYIAKTVNGEAVEIPPDIEKEIYEAAFNANSNPATTRRRVAELNEEYAQYATFGQQISIIFSEEQIRENTEMGREFSAYVASVLTPQQRQEQQNAMRAAAAQMGMCPALSNPASMRYVTLEVGQRPDLDQRLLEDTTGATFFE